MPEEEVELVLNDYHYLKAEASPLRIVWSTHSSLVFVLPICLGGVWYFQEWKKPWWVWARKCKSRVPRPFSNLF